MCFNLHGLPGGREHAAKINIHFKKFVIFLSISLYPISLCYSYPSLHVECTGMADICCINYEGPLRFLPPQPRVLMDIWKSDNTQITSRNLYALFFFFLSSLVFTRMGIHQGGEDKQVVLFAFINCEYELHVKEAEAYSALCWAPGETAATKFDPKAPCLTMKASCGERLSL